MNNRILAVEDDPDILFIVQYILTEEGYDVYTSSDGKDIMSKVNEIHPDLILMDIMLPNADGRLLCKEIKQENSDIPIILMSANVDYSTQYSQVCANGFIEKPFDVSNLIKKVGAYLA